MKIANYEVRVLVGNGAVKEYFHNVNGSTKAFIESRFGSEYRLQLKNNTSSRVLAIVAVDGLNVVSGEQSDGYGGRGYIIPAYDSREITGWRIDDKSVSSFKFDRKSAGYAASKGLEGNSGVISVNFLLEAGATTWTYVSTPKQPSPWFGDGDLARQALYSQLASTGLSFTTPNMTYSCCVNNMQQVASTPITQKCKSLDSSTSWGGKRDDQVTRAHFNKGSIAATFNLYYSTRKCLEGMGVKFTRENEISLPDGFTGYCKPPSGWVC